MHLLVLCLLGTLSSDCLVTDTVSHCTLITVKLCVMEVDGELNGMDAEAGGEAAAATMAQCEGGDGDAARAAGRAGGDGGAGGDGEGGNGEEARGASARRRGYSVQSVQPPRRERKRRRRADEAGC